MEEFEPGQVIFEQVIEILILKGTFGEKFYIIIEGLVGIYINKDNNLLMVGKRKKGDYFGELAMILNQKRAATIKALEHTFVIVVKKS